VACHVVDGNVCPLESKLLDMVFESRDKEPTNVWRQGTLAVLAVSFSLRVLIVVRGGQQFWPDEGRFHVARRTAISFLAGHWRQGLTTLFASADHLLFKVIAVLPALVEQRFHTQLWVPGLFFAIISTWMCYLISRVAKAAGGSQVEVFLAALFSASTTSLFYYSRHFFPYDLSIAFTLIGILTWLKNPIRLQNAFVVGLWLCLGFMTYNAYWGADIAIMIFTGVCSVARRQTFCLPEPYGSDGLFCAAILRVRNGTPSWDRSPKIVPRLHHRR
jgi:hypothetical protein